jgi:arsenate reductase (glutaredoxin)
VRDVSDLEIFHNPSCSKSRGALQIATDRGLDATVTHYLKTPPDRATLERIVDVVADEPAALVRKDATFSSLGLEAGDYVTRGQVVDLLLEHPELMERPVVIVDGRGVIARPPEKMLDLLADGKD